MKNNFSFSYRYFEIPPFGKIFYPYIAIGLKTVDKGFVDFEFIVDTGADLTTLPFFMAERLGLDLKKADKSKSCGIGGHIINTWITRIPIYFQRTEYFVRASITSDNDTPLLLGRIDLLDQVFSWNFDSLNKKIIFQQIRRE